MSGIAELKLYSPLQVDIIDRDAPGHAIPFQAVGCDRRGEYTRMIMDAFRGLQSQEDARDAFVSPGQDWSEVCDKIVSLTRTVELVNGRPYSVFTCRSKGELSQEQVEALKGHCRDQWARGWGKGYAHCPREGVSLGLYIHFWQDDAAPLLTRREFDSVQIMAWGRISVIKITPDTFWMLIDQAKTDCGGDQRTMAYWLMDRLMALGPEQTLKFHSILHGYMELADKYGLWNAAIVMTGDGCGVMEFKDFRAWLISQGRGTYLAALKDPDSLARVLGGGSCRFPFLPHVAGMAYYRLTGRTAHLELEPEEQRCLVEELRKDIVYGAEIGYPHEWPEMAAYLPRLTAQHTTQEELRSRVRRGSIWNHDDPGIREARAAPKEQKTKTGKKKGGEAR